MTISKALSQLRPGEQWHLIGDEKYENIVWTDANTSIPSREEVEPLAAQFIADYKATQYRKWRKKEYPPITDYLDAVVKGDLEQQQAYIDACLAVKAKYPKPEGA